MHLHHLSAEKIAMNSQVSQVLQVTNRTYLGLLGRVSSPRKIVSVVSRKATVPLL